MFTPCMRGLLPFSAYPIDSFAVMSISLSLTGFSGSAVTVSSAASSLCTGVFTFNTGVSGTAGTAGAAIDLGGSTIMGSSALTSSFSGRTYVPSASQEAKTGISEVSTS